MVRWQDKFRSSIAGETVKIFGLNLSLSGGAPKTKLTSSKPATIHEPSLSASTIKILLEQTPKPANKIELLKLYEAALPSSHCPLSPVLSNYVLELSLNDDDIGVRRAARDIVIKTLAHDKILLAWDANRDGQTEELTGVIETCLKIATNKDRDHDIRFDAFIVAEKIITRLPDHATDPVRVLLTSLALVENSQLAEKAKSLLYYIEEQVKDETLRDANSALRNLTARGRAIELMSRGHKS